MWRIISISILLSFSLAAHSSYYRCEVISYAGGIRSTGGALTEAQNIVKSWIPPHFVISSGGLRFLGREFITLEREPKNGVYHARLKAKMGRKSVTARYRVSVEDDLQGNISMQITGFKKMGPLRIKCTK